MQRRVRDGLLIFLLMLIIIKNKIIREIKLQCPTFLDSVQFYCIVYNTFTFNDEQTFSYTFLVSLFFPILCSDHWFHIDLTTAGLSRNIRKYE